MPEAEAATLAELRRRMQGSFSPGELRDLGVALGLCHVESWDRGAESAIRDIVRRAHDGPGLGVLLDRLRLDRPLVEWPEPPSIRAAEPGPAQPADESRGQPSATSASYAPAPIPDLDGPTIVDPYAGPAHPAALPAEPVAGAIASSDTAQTSLVGAPRPAATSEGTDAPSSATSPPASWPLQNLREPDKKPGLDTRILAIAIACVALAVAVAFAGGMVFSRRGAPPSVAQGGRAETLAGHAANVMDGAIVEVARGCGLLVEGPPDRSVLKRAQASCGHPVNVAGRPGGGYDPADIDPPKLDVAPASPRPKPITGPAETPAPPTDLCRAACKSERRTCKSACGAEPQDASAFEAFQQCHSKCLGAESTCRQRCQ